MVVFPENILMETLRVRSVFRTQRQAAADTTIGPGIKIKKGHLHHFQSFPCHIINCYIHARYFKIIYSFWFRFTIIEKIRRVNKNLTSYQFENMSVILNI